MTKFHILIVAIALAALGVANADGVSGTMQLTSAMITAALGFTPPSNALASAHVLVGNASNIATDTALSGDASVTNAGVQTNINFHPTVRVITAAGTVTVATTDYVVCINKTSGAATTANLYATPATGSMVWIKDCKGDAATNNITITPAAGTIDGSATDVLNANFAAALLVYNGTQWNVLSESSGLL